MPEFSSFLDLDADFDLVYTQLDGNTNAIDSFADRNDTSHPQHALPDGFLEMLHLQPHQLSAAASIPPPTPNSMTIHPEDADHYVQQFMSNPFTSIPDPQTQFTSRASPVVQPNYNGQYTAYTVPGPYLSPLTSPALDAQQYQYQRSPNPLPIDTAVPTFPINFEISPHPQNPPETQQQNNSSNKSTSRKRPSALSDQMLDFTNQAVSPALGPRRTRKPNLSKSRIQFTTADASTPLRPTSDTSMPPPPPPLLCPSSVHQQPPVLSTSASPALRPCPATPASIMRINTSPTTLIPLPYNTNTTNSASTYLLPLSLPESAASSTASIGPALNHAIFDPPSNPPTPSRKTPKTGPLSTPSGSMPVTPLSKYSPKSPPQNSTLASSSASAPFSRKAEPRGRTSKRRTNVSISPAILPKISPNIGPLNSDQVTTNDSHALFLTSRSNYQNLIDGTHLPGISYPSELSTILTSKRTSHKIAEQGRRNRINQALQEMLKLLPTNENSAVKLTKSPSTCAIFDANGVTTTAISPDSLDSDDDDAIEANAAKINSKKTASGTATGDGGPKTNANSKAATVETAIAYIKALQQQQQDQAKERNEYRKTIELLEKKLEILEELLTEKGIELPNDKDKVEKNSMINGNSRFDILKSDVFVSSADTIT